MAATTNSRHNVALTALVAGVSVGYALLGLNGYLVFITKTAILPLVLLYGLLQRDRVAFLRDWLPFVGGTMLFDFCRGAIFLLVQADILPVYARYVIAVEWAVTGSPAAPLLLQPYRTLLLDRLFVAWHATHFVMLFAVGLAFWHFRRDHFKRFRATMFLIMVVGIVGYALVPTVPPWLAARDGIIPAVDLVRQNAYAASVPRLVEAFDTNPVAAMPSLHLAFPVAYTWLVWWSFGRLAGLALAGYTVLMALAVMYLGEHYAVDLFAGGIVGWLVVRFAVGRHRDAEADNQAQQTNRIAESTHQHTATTPS